MKVKEYNTSSGNPIRLILGDCMELMAGKPGNHWDLAIVDPPYGINQDTTQRNLSGQKGFNSQAGTYKEYHKTDWDSKPPKNEYFQSLINLTGNQIIWGGNYFYNLNLSGVIVWNKGNSGKLKEGELAKTSFNTFKIYYYSRADAYINKCKSKIHPTQKPVALYRWLLNNYATEGDRILDTHGGSMSLAIACHMEGFELDIIELDEDYYNAAVKRFEQHISQTTLFVN